MTGMMIPKPMTSSNKVMKMNPTAGVRPFLGGPAGGVVGNETESVIANEGKHLLLYFSAQINCFLRSLPEFINLPCQLLPPLPPHPQQTLETKGPIPYFSQLFLWPHWGTL
jgi:hypothetical protein